MTDKAQGAAAADDLLYEHARAVRQLHEYGHSEDRVRNLLDAEAAIRAALKAQPAPVEAQGEDSARLDWIIKEAVQGATYHGITSANVIISEADWREFGLRAAIDKIRARASAEAGGVKS